jgi:hypothetical protein
VPDPVDENESIAGVTRGTGGARNNRCNREHGARSEPPHEVIMTWRRCQHQDPAVAPRSPLSNHRCDLPLGDELHVLKSRRNLSADKNACPPGDANTSTPRDR